MTCLYCGKKLGFFSRYKDTPFCSEEHLRIHQDELERALMERLGSKVKSPQKPLAALAAEPVSSPTPTRSLLGLGEATRAQHPAPLAAEPPKPAQPDPEDADFLLEVPSPKPALEVSTPLIPPSSFAIIVQADCCTPQLAAGPSSPAFPAEDSEFLLEPRPLSSLGDIPPPPQAWLSRLTEDSAAVSLPRRTPLHVEIDFGLEADLLPLDYEVELTSLGQVTLGQRNEIPPRPRLRYPYAASQVSSALNFLPFNSKELSLSAAEDWDAINSTGPQLSGLPQSSPETPQIAASIDVPLTIHSLLEFELHAAEAEDPGDSFSVFAHALAAVPSLPLISFEDWAPQLALPLQSSTLRFEPRWQAARTTSRVPPVSFPSLFQLGPVLPPRPESRVS